MAPVFGQVCVKAWLDMLDNALRAPENVTGPVWGGSSPGWKSKLKSVGPERRRLAGGVPMHIAAVKRAIIVRVLIVMVARLNAGGAMVGNPGRGIAWPGT